MFAKYPSHRARARRRGIVLVLILGMLGLLALIGVTFATFAGQSLVNARNFNLSENRPNAEQYMDFALAQLINDTNNPLSALRGHSLLRDMYGNDSVHRGTTAAEIRGYLDRVTANNGQLSSLYFTGTQTYGTNVNSPFTGMTQYITNIPTANLSYQYFGLNFTRWILRLTTTGAVAQTFEVLEDDDTSGNYHVLTLGPGDGATGIYLNSSVNGGNPVAGTPIALASVATGSAHSFSLDGRYMRAFNGPGMSRSLTTYALANMNTNTVPTCNYPIVPFNVAAFANFRVNGGFVNPNFPSNNIVPGSGATGDPSATPGDPDAIGMDEDYDACDLENWFLAIQSADGQVVVPSFHRPGILTASDWSSTLNVTTPTMAAIAGASKILRPRAVDHSPGFPADPSTPDATGKITYDVDNDGDGETDSVWLDLGYPVQKDPGGKLFKPLFAFMVIGQNGRLPLNTVGNLQSRDFQTTKQYGGVIDGNNYPINASPQTWYDAPTWDHASHLGYSANEVNPKYALQNASANVYSSTFTSINYSATYPYGPVVGDSNYSQIDNSYVDVALTQLRNLLAGTVPQDKLLSTSVPIDDSNWVYVNGQQYYMPNGVIDGNDTGYNSKTPLNSLVGRHGVQPVPGRWGEVEGVPVSLSIPDVFANVFNTAFNSVNTPNIYTNPVRAGRSFYSAVSGNTNLYAYNSSLPTGDGNDDDLDAVAPAFLGAISEYAAILDNAGQYALASQRMQRFVNPVDPAGVGRVVGFMERPTDKLDYGRGNDSNGRVGHFRYFRPPGVPAEVDFPLSNLLADGYKMGVNSYYRGSSVTSAIPNRTNNRYHGYEGFRAPTTHRAGPYTPYDTKGVYNDLGAANTANIAVFAAAPYDMLGINTITTTAGVPSVTSSIFQQVTSITPDLIQLAYAIPAPPASTNNPYNVYTTPTISSSVNSESGPWMFGYYDVTYPNTTYPSLPNFGNNPPTLSPVPANQVPAPQVLFDQLQHANGVYYAQVVNGYPLGSLNKDEADEMNLYNPNFYDQQFGPSDLEWLYRKQDVDGATLDSRLSKLAPISFTNPTDGLTRRRLFSVESWEPNSFVYANDNPQGVFPTNSRFGQLASANLSMMNQVAAPPNSGTVDPEYLANAFATEALFNPTLASPINSYTAHPKASAVGLPVLLTGANNASSHFFQNSTPATLSGNPHHADYFTHPDPTANTTAYPTTTPALAHRDRRINLNMPFPVASDPAEPVRQKWVRETYQLLKSILPPQAVDTPQELAALSQFVVNIVDFRDPDCTTTRFVNTDLMVIEPTPASASVPFGIPSGVQFATVPFPGTGLSSYATLPVDPNPPWDPNPVNSKTSHTFGPFDPYIAWEQTSPGSMSDWVAATTVGTVKEPPYLVQYGMEYSPIALNEVLCYTFNAQPNLTYSGNPPYPPQAITTTTATTSQAANAQTTRFYIELVNTLTDESTHPIGATGSADLDLRGWDFVITPDLDPLGRPDPITGCLMANVGGVALPAPTASTANPPAQGNMNPPDPANPGGYLPGGTQTLTSIGGMFPSTAIGWSVGQTGLQNATGAASRVPPIRSTGTGNPAPTYYVMANPVYVAPTPAATSPPTLIATQVSQSADPIPVVANPNAQMPGSFFPSTTTTAGVVKANPPAAGTGNYYWLYLRRPANPFNENSEMVVVDSIRFPWAADDGNGSVATVIPTNNNKIVGNQMSAMLGFAATTSATQLFSAQRQQPYKGGHLVTGSPPTAAATTPPFPNPPYAYGYSEQTIPSMGTAAMGYGYGYWVGSTASGNNTTAPVYSNVKVTQKIYESLGNPTAGGDPYWDYFPFHDRDFASPAELMLVPGCPPGLFTKQFAEFAYNDTLPTYTNGAGSTVTPPYGPNSLATGNLTATATTTTMAPYPATTTAFTGGVPHAFPYLVDKFFYTAASVNNDPGVTPAAYPSQVGGWTGMGWHKMFDFFEVPSSANGAIGTADNGENFDWARADRKPGLINLNLIMDDEVFFGLLDDPRLNIALANYYSYGGNSPSMPTVVSQVDANGFPTYTYAISDPTLLSTTYLAPGQAVPTLLNTNGLLPAKYYVGRGFTYGDPTNSGLILGNAANGINQNTGHGQNTISGMKGAFIDFLKLRHGGSNYLFAHGAGAVQDGSKVPTSTTAGPDFAVPEDRMFHSLSYPDINYTIMRPAYLPPSQYTSQVPNPVPATLHQYVLANTTYLYTDPHISGLVRAYDPSVRFPWIDNNFITGAYVTAMPTTAAWVPPIPPRRLFQVPDQYEGTNLTTQPTVVFNPSNASITGDTTINVVNVNQYLTYRTGNDQSTFPMDTLRYPNGLSVQGGNSLIPYEPQYAASPYPGNVQANLPTSTAINPATTKPYNVNPVTNNTWDPFQSVSYFLGASPGHQANGNLSPTAQDRRQHPYYRTEMLQKVMNLTTVRTHQFAVWITVGFFEVTHAGTPELGQPDVLGGELNLAAGNAVRYRSFFVIDRTKATGFNPYYPGEFRDCVTYRRRIQ